MLDFAIFAGVLMLFLIGLVVYLYPGRPKRLSTVPGMDPADCKGGNLADIGDAGGLHPFLKELHEDYGPIASFWWGEQFVVSTAHPDMFRPQMNLFDRPPELFLLFEPLIGKQSIQYINGAEGRALRHSLDKPFSHEACQNYVPVLSEIANDLAAKLRRLTGDHHVPLRQYMMALAFRAILLIGFGDYFVKDDVCVEFVKDYDICWNEMEQRLIDPAAATDQVRVAQFEKAKASLQRQIRNVLKARKRETETSKLDAHRFIDELIDLSLSEEQEFSVALTYVIGGFHTTGNLLTWMIYFVITHPECEEKLRKELKTVLGDRPITANDIKDLGYCRQVIDETLRLSVLAPYAARLSSIDLKIGGHVIPKETPIIQALGVAQSDPTLWPEPTKFDPNRFHPDQLKRTDSLAYPSFGFAGKRKCPGYRLAYVEAVIFLAMMLQNFGIKLANPEQVVTPVYGLVTHPDDEIWIMLESLK